jgi:hypothetical protein
MPKLGWTIGEWLAQIPVSRSKLYSLIEAGSVRVAKIGRRTIVTTSPEQYLAGCPKTLGASWRTGTDERGRAPNHTGADASD